MSRRRAGIDLDGVVHQWSPTARKLLRERFGIEIGESLSWDWIKEHCTAEQWKWLWAEDGGIRAGLFLGRPYPGAIEALRRLYDSDHDLVIITARPQSAIPHTFRWLGQRGIVANEVHVMRLGEPKSQVECDWYVDDNLDNADELAHHHRRVFLFDQPWNSEAQGFKTPAGAWRVYGWDDLLANVI